MAITSTHVGDPWPGLHVGRQALEHGRILTARRDHEGGVVGEAPLGADLRPVARAALEAVQKVRLAETGVDLESSGALATRTRAGVSVALGLTVGAVAAEPAPPPGTVIGRL